MNIETIRRGLAANLRAVPDCQVSAYMLDNPTGPTLQIAGFDQIDYLQDFGPGQTLHMLVEGCAAGGDSRAAYTRFDKWLLRGTDTEANEHSVVDALLANRQLTSRLLDNGTVQTGQPAVCDDLIVIEFRGYRWARGKDGSSEVLIGNWAIDLLT